MLYLVWVGFLGTWNIFIVVVFVFNNNYYYCVFFRVAGVVLFVFVLFVLDCLFLLFDHLLTTYKSYF